MASIRRKLRSERGASITFALLLFLVCAVVSSVAIVAATTSSGRLAQLGKMDQRYYAVNSAAELICDIFVGTALEPTPAVTVSYDANTGAVDSGKTQSESADALLLNTSEQLVTALATGSDGEKTNLTLSGTAGEISLDCDIEAQVFRNGLALFTVRNAGEAPFYKLEVTLASNVKRIGTVSSGGIGKMQVKWKLHSIKKDRTDVAESAVIGG